MANTKDERIYIRVAEKIRDEFDLVAEHRGLTRSGLLHSLIVRTIHDAKKEAPEIFVIPAAPESGHTKVGKSEKTNDKVMTLEEAKADDESKKSKGKKGK